MSNFRQPNGDDYPDAARKHLDDADVLLVAGRHDGAGYHAGYVVECALKTLLQADRASIQTIRKLKHNLSDLSHQVAALATGGSPHTARYIPNPPPAIPYGAPPIGWYETMRYRAAGDLDQAKTQTWVTEAQRVYQKTVQQMRLDGVIV
jgi:hypothetical protein